MSEDIELPSFEDKPRIKYNLEEDDYPKSKKKLIIAVVIIVGVIVLGLLIFLVIYFSSKKDENGGSINIVHVINDETFDFSKNELTILNIGNLKKSDFTIEKPYIGDSVPTSSVRSLVEDFTLSDDGRLFFNNKKILYGKISFTINFNSPLKRMDGMFQNLKTLYKADLSRLKSEKVKYMNNLFSNCENLNSVNFNNFNSKKVETMESSFENCINLIELDLSSFKTPKLRTLKSTFKNCKNLDYLDLSNFDLNSNLIDREDIFTQTKISKIKVNNKNTKDLLYSSGNITSENNICSDNCESCNGVKCTKCVKGYYLFDSNYASKCKKCYSGCDNCSDYDICGKCKIGYRLILTPNNNRNCINETYETEPSYYAEEEEESEGHSDLPY